MSTLHRLYKLCYTIVKIIRIQNSEQIYIILRRVNGIFVAHIELCFRTLANNIHSIK